MLLSRDNNRINSRSQHVESSAIGLSYDVSRNNLMDYLLFSQDLSKYVVISGKQAFVTSRSPQNDPVISGQHLLFRDNDINKSRPQENK